MDNKLRALLLAAVGKTASGELVWRPFDERTFLTPIGRGMLKIGREYSSGENADGVPERSGEVYSVWVMNSKGQVVLEDGSVLVSNSDYALFFSLFESARRSALNTDGVLDEMLATLGTDN